MNQQVNKAGASTRRDFVRTCFFVGGAVAMGVAPSGCSGSAQSIPPKALAALQGADEFELFSLDPRELSQEELDAVQAGKTVENVEGEKPTNEPSDAAAAKPDEAQPANDGAGETKLFQRWKIRQAVSIQAPDDRKKLIRALEAGVAASDGMVAACFNPRHAIRVTFQGKTYEFVICFECLSVQWREVGGSGSGSFLTTNGPAPTFNGVLEQYSTK